MKMCPECDIEMEVHTFGERKYYYCTQCQKEVVMDDDENNMEENREEDEEISEEEEHTFEDEEESEEEEDREEEIEEEEIEEISEPMSEEDDMKGRIRNILTPDVRPCTICITDHREDITCSKCGIIMFKPDYDGKVYECPICGKPYCENCIDKTD